MRFKENDLREFGGLIEKILAGDDLSEQQAYEAFVQVLSERQPELNQGAFLAALRAKGENVDEIAGCWRAIMDLDTVNVEINSGKMLVENCGTGMDRIKTFNISTASAIVASSLGVPMARHGARAITSNSGTVDMAEALGVDVECSVEVVKQSIEKSNIGLFNGMSVNVHPGGLFRILKHIRFGSILNIAASLANPASPRIGVRGVYDDSLLDTVVSLMNRLGYEKGIVYTGFDSVCKNSMDEVSTMGITRVVEFDNGEQSSYTLSPEDMRIPRGTYEDIKPLQNFEDEIVEFLKAFTDPSHSSRVDAICVNTAPILYVCGRARDYVEGAAMAREAIMSGRALKQLKLWVMTQNRDPEKGIRILEKRLASI